MIAQPTPHTHISPPPVMVPQAGNSSQQIITGFEKVIQELRIRMSIARIALRNYSPIAGLRILKSLDALRRKVMGPHRISKLSRVNGKFYWDLYTPGWPSPGFDRVMEGEMNRITPLRIHANRFTNVFLSITKKCPLQCEHCFEWKALNGRDRLSLQDIHQMVGTFQKMGTGQIQLTGGEPMLKVPEIVQILQEAKGHSDFWVLTSGFNLTDENAQTLRKAGLTGVVVSLDHFDREMHNTFRGYKNAFDWAQLAVRNAIRADLVTALSLCATKDFVSEDNLLKYAHLSKEMGVSFIQILEPKAVGHYEGKDVLIKKEHEDILDAFMLKMNYDPAFKSFPIVSYHGYYQRQTGCFGAGNRNLYVDTDGDIHACPFCHNKIGNALSGNLEESIACLQSIGCHSYKNFSN